MTRDEIVRLARLAGFQTGWINDAAGDPSFPLVQPVGSGCVVEMERFAELVEATIRDTARLEGWQAAREQAAKVCEDTDVEQFTYCQVLHDDGPATLRSAAESIRAMQPPAEWGDMGIPISAPPVLSADQVTVNGTYWCYVGHAKPFLMDVNHPEALLYGMKDCKFLGPLVAPALPALQPPAIRCEASGVIFDWPHPDGFAGGLTERSE